MNAQGTKTPKRDALNRRVNFVWFVETSRTHSFSLSFRALGLLVLAAVAVMATVALQAVQIRHQRSELTAHQTLIKELKLAVVRNLFAQSQATSVASLAATPIPPPQKQTIPPAEPAPRLSKDPGSLQTSPSKTPDESGVRFDKAEWEPGEGIATVRFGLQNTGAEQSLAGRVCAIVHTSEGAALLVSGGSLKPLGKAEGCPEGLSVRFSRYRPTEIQIKIDPSIISSIELRFAESTRRRVSALVLTN